MKILFCNEDDIREAYGKLTFGADGLSYYGNVSGIPSMRARCAVSQDDGSYMIYGLAGGHDTDWRIIRSRTFDGVHYDNTEAVHHEPAGPWLTEADIAYNANSKSLLCLKWKRGEKGHALWAFGSEDGFRWRSLSDSPAYVDHDAFGLTWDEKTQCYIVYQTTYQNWPKRYPDNIGDHRRRILHIRSSEDGIHWEPSEDVFWNGPYMSDKNIIMPDNDDPEEMEFYRLTVFPYEKRYIGMMLNYAPSPQVANPSYPWNKHGPQLSGEWWISEDGYNWQRPYRDVFAPGEAPGIVMHNPINLDGKHMWIINGSVYGLPVDRIFFIGSMANAEFSTHPFVLQSTPLILNVSNCFHNQENRGMGQQSYIMAEILDEEGQVIDGFSREDCILQGINGSVRLHWKWNDGRHLIGRNIKMRFYLRDARIYSLSNAD
jgi:hypothetical protein